jgi:hypothetical protein
MTSQREIRKTWLRKDHVRWIMSQYTKGNGTEMDIERAKASRYGTMEVNTSVTG